MFTQPITLRFDGETLQIYENGNKLDGYDARSGVAEEQRKKTDGNKTEYVKEVAYPSVKSNNDDSNTVDNSNKFFYYDDSNTSKIPEGEYYIMANDIKTNPYNSTEALNTQGSKYMHIYPYYNLDFYNEELFNKTINTAHNTMEAVGHYNFLTSYLIHGGTDYEDNYGIDLSSNITTFCNDLTTLVNDTYKDKLYKVYGKVPIKLNVSYKSECIFPLKMEPVNSRNNSKYSLYAWDKEVTEGLVQTMFGSGRSGGRKHGGIDLYTGESTSGEVVAIADGTILDARLFYNKTDQISIYHEINGKPYIVRYGELTPIQNKKKLIGTTVKQGDKLGETGVLIENDGTKTKILNNKPMRMLHFEVFNMEIDGVSIDELKKIEENSKYVLTNFRDDLSKPKYNRRKDIINPLEILKQGYEASKKSGNIK